MYPDISIIIPAYNTEDYIRQAIESALNQTLINIEVIVVDDASTDRTLEIVQQFTDPRLKLLKNFQNLGVSATRNHALAVARGEWIAVLDSDDWYAANRLEKLLGIAHSQNADVVIDDLHLIQTNAAAPWSTLLQESGEAIQAPRQIDPVFYVETGIYGQRGLHLGLCKPIFRRSFLARNHLRYDEDQQVVEDFQLALKCLLAGAKMIFVPTPYYFYRSRPNSLVTQSNIRHIEQFKAVLVDFLQQAQEKQNPQLALAISESLSVLEKNRTYYCVIEKLKQGNFLSALKAAVRNGNFWTQLFSRLRTIIWRRYRYYILKDKLIYEIVYYNHRKKEIF